MPSIESRVQGLVHALEAGFFAKWIKLAVVVVVFAGVSTWLLLQRYRGLSTREGMENVVVAREIARGHGLSTPVLRPLAMWQVSNNKGKEVLATDHFPETLIAPVYPMLLGGVFAVIRPEWRFPTTGVFVWRPDLIVALLGIAMFAVGAGISYLAIARLFDSRVAAFSCGLTLVCFAFWQTALEGLPVPLMLILFSSALYAMVRAVEAKVDGRTVGLWLALAGLFFGLLALAQPLTTWIFLGAVVFSGIYFKPRILAVTLLVLLFVVCLLPWMAWLYSVSGSPFGIAGYTLFNDIKGNELLHMRQNGLDLSSVGLTWFRPKMQQSFMDQFSGIVRYFGWVLTAPLFFLALAHPFKRPQIAVFRWAILLMWLPAVFGMALFGPLGDDPTSKNLHLLFVPLMSAYGVALLFTILPRASSMAAWIRLGIFTLVFGISSVPLIFELLPQQRVPLNWPPYLPPALARVSELYEPNEILCSDQAWASSWYGDRRTLMLPEKVTEFTRLSDFRVLGRDIPGLIMTPTSGGEKYYPNIIKGDYQDWSGFILRKPNLSMFPLQIYIPVDDDAAMCLWADRERRSAIRRP